MDRVRKLVHCDSVHKMGYTGRKVNAAILDTGISLHPDYRERILVFADFCHHKERPYDDNGHGSHIAGIIGGSGQLSRGRYRGMAPGVGLIILKVLDESGNGNTGDVLQAMDWIIQNRKKYRISLANISVGMLPGSKEREQGQLLAAVEKMWNHGIFTVVAAGNAGPGENTVTIPGSSGAVLTVGSSDDRLLQSKRQGLFPGYSGTGPTDSCICKPEILAPGTGITSCSKDAKGYAVKSGTSMATAVVTGACALALDRYPFLSPLELKLLFYQKLAQRGEGPYWGTLDVKELLD